LTLPAFKWKAYLCSEWITETKDRSEKPGQQIDSGRKDYNWIEESQRSSHPPTKWEIVGSSHTMAKGGLKINNSYDFGIYN
jgi:hypothetical protein